ncbi:MAG: helix-turn-helix transcriptional regulator [Provencibacterium sp.]|nr:helix-turn-helix transcriptional regulator [Provencibacterium sp.]
MTVTQLDDCAKLETYLNEHRINAVLLECGPDFQQEIEHIHYIKPALPVVLYGEELSHEQTRSAFLCGAVDALHIRGATSEDCCDALERALDSLRYTSDSAMLHQTRSIKVIAHRGRQLELQLAEGNPPPFYMNGNRATLLRADVLCTKPSAFWQQDAAWEWIQEFGVHNSFLLPGADDILHLGAIVEQDFINAASFKVMLHTRLERCYSRLRELNCICAACHCSSDFLSRSTLHHLDNQAELIFYLNDSQTIPDLPRRLNSTLPAELYTEFCSAAATRDTELAVHCVDRATEKLRTDMPAPNFAKAKLNRFLWEFASVMGSQGDHCRLLMVDVSHIDAMRDSIVEIIRSTLACKESIQSVSPLEELIHRIETNPGLSISIDQAAEEINFSRSHFCRLFRQQTGLSFTAFLTQKRIALACDLMRKTGMRIDEISDTVGINNTWYFKKLFQKETGMRAEDWIAENRPLEVPPRQ